MRVERSNVILGQYVLSSKAAARDFLRDILYSYKPGQYVSQDHADILLSVIERHPDREQKVGAGIVAFSVGNPLSFGHTKCFYLHRRDGTSTDFSFYKCLTPTHPRTVALRAARNAIRAQIVAFRDAEWPEAVSFLDRMCPITGDMFPRHQAHVDHVPPLTFATLFDRWCAKFNMQYPDILVTPVADNVSVVDLADQLQRASWSTYHRENAKLRIVSWRGNLSLGRSEDRDNAF